MFHYRERNNGKSDYCSPQKYANQNTRENSAFEMLGERVEFIYSEYYIQ